MNESYELIRPALHPSLRALPAEQLEALVESTGLEPELLEDFFGDLGRRLPGIISGAAQGAGAGSVAGPWGALIGGLGGAVAGGLTAPPAPAPPRRRPAPAIAAPVRAVPVAVPRQAAPPSTPVAAPAPVPAVAAPVPAPQDGSAATQLLTAVMQPQVLQALLALALGGSGAPAVTTSSGESVPVAAVGNMLGALGARAAAEYEDAVGGTAGPEAVYLDGVEDIGDPQARAEATFAALVRDPAPRPPLRRPAQTPRPGELELVQEAMYDEVYA